MNVNLKDVVSTVPGRDIANMKRRIEKALKEREAFERAKSPNGAHIELERAKNYILNNRRFAAFMVATNSDPNELLNRSRKVGYRANLKGIKKVKMLCDYVTGRTKVFERTSLALFASTIIAALRGINWISNNEQELILSNLDVGSLPKDVQEAIAEYKHKYMSISGDSRNQSCQFRTTFENLGCFYQSREDCDDMNRLGIGVNLDNPIIQHLIERWNLKGK